MILHNTMMLNCYGCEYKCRELSPELASITFCAQAKVTLWPEDNYFFKRAMKEWIPEIICPEQSSGIILVDFSIDNLLYFIDDGWLDMLKKYKMHIVLMCDREMLSLARYWLNREWRVLSVLDATDNTRKVIQKICEILHWKSVPPPKGKSIIDNEVKMLRHMLEGTSIANIASALGCSLKSAYGYQYSLCEKFGGLHKISDLRFKYQMI